jgi:type 2 lantibiotic biosynthesis protein LanM
MLDDSLIVELACRASNLAERRLIVEQLAKGEAKVACNAQLGILDNWNIKKLTGKLAAQLIKDSYEQGTIGKSTIEEVQELLTTYKLYERNLSNLPEENRNEFVKPHTEWLETYKAAILTLDLPKDEFVANGWYEADIYYGKFAKACEPFLRLVYKTLEPVRQEVNATLGNCEIVAQVVREFQIHLLNRFDLALAWAIEANINVYCSKKNVDKSVDNPEAYIAYLEETFENGWCYHRFYSQFPVLARWLAQITRFECNYGEELIRRLGSDIARISKTFFEGKPISKIKSFKLGKSDNHAGGKSVVIVELEINSCERKIVYKPRCIQSEAAMQGLLENLNRDKVVNFGNYRVLCQENYGYTEFIVAGNNDVQSREEVEKFYQQQGGFLAIFHVLGGGDLHYENILVSEGNAFICDCETVLEVLPRGMDKLSGTVMDSVFKTGMLEWPSNSDAENQMKISGYSGGESYELPHTVPRVNDRRMSLGVGVEYKPGVRIEVEGTNRIYYQGQLVQPQDYKDSIVDGFNRVYNWFKEDSTKVGKLLEELFSPSSVRFINWGTEAYSKLMVAIRHPKCLAEPLEVDLLFNTLKEHRRPWDKEGKLAEMELAALWQLDVPIFTAKASGNWDLVYNYQETLPEMLAISPLDNALKRIEKLSEENRIRQNQYIYTSLSTEEINSPYFIASAVNYAQQIGWHLCELLQTDSNEAPWKTWDYTATGKRLVDIGTDIYSGSAGICLFLAYLDAIHPQPEFKQAAERALKHAIEQRKTTFIGAYQGTAGLIYLLTHLAQLWDRPTLLDLAVELTDELIPRISEDRYFDVLMGVSGIIPIMLNLADATDRKGIDVAVQCAQHLLQEATRQGDTLSWPCGRSDLIRGNLTGFSHGGSGVGWALILLGCRLDKQEYIEAGRQGFAYEAIHFDENQRDWYDLRKSVMTADSNEPHFANAWCNGAAGIGLSRIATWAVLGKNDEDMLREAYAALNATLRNFDKLGNDSLCHGRAGNAELFLRFSQLRELPYLRMEANVQAQAQWRRFEKARTWMCGSTGNDLFADLMLGIAGIGMHFLRLAYPERVPSPLLLDPPPKV